MPAAAVIPAPIAYIKVVAVKKLVVEYLAGAVLGSLSRCSAWSSVWETSFVLHWSASGSYTLL